MYGAVRYPLVHKRVEKTVFGHSHTNGGIPIKSKENLSKTTIS